MLRGSAIQMKSLRAEPREAWQSTIEMNQFYVYIMTCKNNTVLYTGVTRDLKKRAHEHRSNVSEGFTNRYNLIKLVYYEALSDPHEAIGREKNIKAGTRARKIALVSGFNPGWTDLYEKI
jgi:putative endonuclease